jgi:hypothetical protein
MREQSGDFTVMDLRVCGTWPNCQGQASSRCHLEPHLAERIPHQRPPVELECFDGLDIGLVKLISEVVFPWSGEYRA